MTPYSPHQSTIQRPYLHRLRGTNILSDEVLIITSYDYFLQKKGLKILLKKYKEILLVPKTVDDNFLINQTVGPILETYDKIHLVTNPQSDGRYYIIYELVVRKNKTIRISTVYDFCEKTLGKVYVPDQVEELNPYIPNQLSLPKSVRVVKFVFDIVASFILLLFSLPVWLVSAYRIRQESPGPIFYSQERIGLHQASFPCIKFRSMATNAEEDGATFSKKNDSRIFRFGAFMRLTRIDELPQLLNVFRGEISLIGPRPERSVFIDSFEEIIPYYNLRHVIKPGITGYAQVMYPYGSGAYDARHKLMYDLYYIKNWSFGLEIKIILLTVLSVLTKKGR